VWQAKNAVQIPGNTGLAPLLNAYAEHGIADRWRAVLA
jgi:hypothetical protein